ncbi:MAG TPA: PTS sugar transporter subunit IIC [Malonomonas sp.]
MIAVDLLFGGLVSLVCGLDRMAILQVMISRPLVAAPLAAWVLGEPLIGLQVGVMVELLWLARLPVGAAVPPDDTQVSVAATVLAITLGRALETGGTELLLLCLLVALPLGKLGQYFDHLARQYNVRLPVRAEAALDNGNLFSAQLQHLLGILSFSLVAVGTYAAIIGGGLLLVPLLWALVQQPLALSATWLQLALPLVGVAVILGTINVSRALTLFCAAFGMAFLLMWLV